MKTQLLTSNSGLARFFRQSTLVTFIGAASLAPTATVQAAPEYSYNSLNQLVEVRLDDGTVVKNYYDGAGGPGKTKY